MTQSRPAQGNTTADHFAEAVRTIDQRFGQGYALKNPHLIASMIQAAAINNAAALIASLLASSPVHAR